ncbi:uncharacterized protein [Nicotiana tomentosiformis]|uniref:uncharacterized protein n=1 Tax=Nicotiana tomentosiformis TaxID=4098 RepID=UPI00388C3657
MDTSYNSLLGRPWIHTARAVPSTLHQMVKFEHENQEIIIHGEDEQSIYRDPSVSCLEGREGSEHIVYQAFEIMVADQCEEGTPFPQPCLSNASIMVTNKMIKHGYKPGKGLGVSLQGITEPVTLTANEKFFGKGFQGSNADIKWADKRKKNGWVLPQPVPHLAKSFVKPNSNNADLNNMTCLRTSCPDPKMMSNCEIMNQEPEYDEGQHKVTGKREQAIYYLSKMFTRYEAKYTLLERTCCALTWVAQKLRHYLLTYTTYLITRIDPLKYIFQKPMPMGRFAKWQILLTEFDIVYVTRTTMKAQALADHLAENPVNDEYQPLSTYFLDEKVNSVEIIPEHTSAWKMFLDGAVNAKGDGIGAILISPTVQHYPATARLRFFCTNNTAEYEACIMGMNMAVDLDVEELLIMGDSNLIIRQAQGEWETRDIKLIPYKQHVEDLSKWFKSVKFRYIPRFHNELADALATLAAMLSYPGNVHINPLEIQIRERHGYCNAVEIEPDVQPWYHDIKKFLKIKEYPEQASEDQKRTIRRLANSFFLSGEVLYKRTPDLNLLRCVDAKEAEKIMNKVHSRMCGGHMNGYVLAKKILRAGYYWMTMENDCFSFVRRCHQC